MAFHDFEYPEVVDQFGLTERTDRLFAELPPIPPSTTLTRTLAVNIALATAGHSEAARSIWMVGPVLAEFWGRASNRVNLFAGVTFNADREDRLTGLVDFLIGRGPQLLHLTAPVVLMFEAKRDNIPEGLGQCVAAMVGAQRYNRRRESEVDVIYGCVTTGSIWRFLRLENSTLTADLDEYSIQRPDALLAILAHVTGVGGLAPA